MGRFKMIDIPYFPKPIVLAVLVAICTVAITCTDNPEAPVRDNPFVGDPFELRSEIAQGGIRLTWNKVVWEGLLSYRVFRSVDDTLHFAALTDVEPQDTVYVDTAVSNGHVYWYYVGAVFAGGVSDRSALEEAGVRLDPVLVINGGADSTATREVSLTILAVSSDSMLIWTDGDSAASGWEAYRSSRVFELATGPEAKVVNLAVRYPDGHISDRVTDTIQPVLAGGSTVTINYAADTTSSYLVALSLNAVNAAEMMVSNSPSMSSALWQPYDTVMSWHLIDGGGAALSEQPSAETRTVYAQFRSEFEEALAPVSDDIVVNFVVGMQINGGVQFAASREVMLTLSGLSVDSMKVSQFADLHDAVWEVYLENRAFTLPLGAGTKTVYGQFKNSEGVVSDVYSDDIDPLPLSNPYIQIADGEAATGTRHVSCSLSVQGVNLQMKTSAEDADFTGVDWESYIPNQPCTLATGLGTKTVYAVFRNDFEIESAVVSDQIDPQPLAPAIDLNGGAGSTRETTVTCSLSLPDYQSGDSLIYSLSESEDFSSGTVVFSPLSSTTFELQATPGAKTVYFRVENDFGIRATSNASIDPMPFTPTFVLNGGIYLTNTAAVNAALSAEGYPAMSGLEGRTATDSGLLQLESWVALESTYTFDFGVTQGINQAWLEMRTPFFETVTLSDSIFLDQTIPTAGILVSLPDSISLTGEFTLTCSMAADNYTPTGSLQYSWDTLASGEWTPWQIDSTRTVRYSVVEPIDISVSCRVRDQAGNVSSDISKIVTVHPSLDPNDLGLVDYFSMTATTAYNNGSDRTEIVLNVLARTDNLATAATAGFEWDNPAVRVDSAVIEPSIVSAFDMMRSLYYRNSIDSSNHNQRLNLAFLAMFGGLPGEDSNRLWVRYYMSADGAGPDVLSLDTIPAQLRLVSGGDEWTPAWVPPEPIEW